MSTIQVLSWVVFVVLAATVAFGVTNAVRWARHATGSFPLGLILTHGVVQCVAVTLWLVFAVEALVVLGWVSFVIATAGQVLGDGLMLRSHSSRRPGTPAGYRAAAASTLSFRRPISALHAICGAVAWFSMLGICIAASVS